MKCLCSTVLLLAYFFSAAQDLSAHLFNSTIKIQGYKDTTINGKRIRVSSIGTGFFFSIGIGKDTVLGIVTNKHVVENCSNGVLRFNSRLDSLPSYGDIILANIPNFDKLWLIHPSEDLAFLPLNPFFNFAYNRIKKRLFFEPFSELNIPNTKQENELLAIEDVLMIGYPKGLSDTINNLPIIRKGITATPVYLNYNKEARFLLDIPIYAGSSGSPIVIYNNTSYNDKKGNTFFGRRFYLLGVAVRSQEYIAKGQTVVDKNSKSIETETWLPYEIAIVIKSSVLLDFKYIILHAIKDKTYMDLLTKSATVTDFK